MKNMLNHIFSSCKIFSIQITRFTDIERDQLLCVSTGSAFKRNQTSQLDIEIKANWSRAHKQYGPTATDVHVEAPANPKVNVSVNRPLP